MGSQHARIRDGFGPLFILTLNIWLTTCHLLSGAFHPALGGTVAALCGFVGAVAAHWITQRRHAAYLHAILTTPQSFAAIPVPLYLIPSLPPLYEAEIAAG